MAIPIIAGQAGSRFLLGSVPRALLGGGGSSASPDINMGIATNGEALKKRLQMRRKQIPYALSLSLNEVVFDVTQEHLPKKANEAFEGGATRFTRKAFRYKKSSKGRLVAHVFVAPNRVDYLKYMVSNKYVGRLPEKRTIGVPTKNAYKNKYGNVPRGTWRKYVGNEQKYFKGIPKQFGNNENKAGIWKVNGENLERVIAYKDQVQYPRIYFSYYKIVKKYVKSNKTGVKARFKNNYRKALRTRK